MGAIYSVIPFGTLGDKDVADMQEYLVEHGLDYPPDAACGRYPTQNEIEEVFRSFGSYEIELCPDDAVGSNNPWSQVSLVKRARPDAGYAFEEYVTLIAVAAPHDKDSPCVFYFSKGSQNANYAVLERLAHCCGPLFCITEGEYDAVIFHRRQSSMNQSPSFARDHSTH